MVMTISDSLPGTIVTRISVYDVDSNPAFTFSFVKESNSGTKFAIDRNTGVVVLVETLDFEEATKYELQIQISDLVHQTEGQSLSTCWTSTITHQYFLRSLTR